MFSSGTEILLCIGQRSMLSVRPPENATHHETRGAGQSHGFSPDLCRGAAGQVEPKGSALHHQCLNYQLGGRAGQGLSHEKLARTVSLSGGRTRDGEVRLLPSLLPLVCPWSSWEELSPRAHLNVSWVRAGNNFHPHSPPDKPSKTRLAIVRSPQVRQLKHKPERQRPSPSEGPKAVPSLPCSCRFGG